MDWHFKAILIIKGLNIYPSQRVKQTNTRFPNIRHHLFKCTSVLPALLCLAKGFSVALALDVQFAVVEPKELDERDFPRLSELTFLVLLVAVLLQSEKEVQ